MAKITRSQLRSIIRESINDAENKRLSRNLRKRLNLKIAERKLNSYKTRIDEISKNMDTILISEGIFDTIKDRLKPSTRNDIRNIKGGVDSAISSLGKYFLGGGAMPGGGYQKSGGLKSKELEKMAAEDPLRDSREAFKKILPALKRFKSVTINDLVDGHGLIPLDSYVESVVDALQALAKFVKDQSESDVPLDANYLDMIDKSREILNVAKETIKSLQRDIQNAALELQKGTESAAKTLKL